jgi:hypothetical protein
MRSLLGQELIQTRTLHDPKWRLPRQHSRHGVLQAPRESHLIDHLIHGGGEIEGKPALNGCSHSATTRLGPGQRLRINNQNAMTAGSKVISR